MDVVTSARDLDPKTWNRFVDEHPHGNIFHRPEMFEVYRLTRGLRPEIVAVLDDEHLLALLLPVQTRVLGQLLPRLTSRSVVYGGALWEPGPTGREALSLALESHEKQLGRKCLFTEIRNLADPQETTEVFVSKGWTYEPHLNYLISLREGTDPTWKALGTKNRNNIRRAERKGVTVRTLSTVEEVATAWELLQQTYQRAKVPLAHLSMFESAFRILSPKGKIAFFLAECDGEPLATRVELLDKDVVYDWYAGCDTSSFKLYPNDVLVWKVLEWGAQQGFSRFDFGGAGHPDEPYGVRSFKAKWQGELVEYGRFERVHAPHLMSLSKAGYAVLRRMI